jgi:hypothetical protein
MPNTTIQFQGGDILANLEARTITGLLIPYNEIGNTNVGRFMVEAGSVAIPADPSVVSINLDHDRSQNVGRAIRIWEEPAGIMATFEIAKTPEGDAHLADAISPTGKRRKLSGEFGPAMIKAGKLVAGYARLWGSGAVGAGAFPSAMVLAQDTPDQVAASILEDLTPDPLNVEFGPDENGNLTIALGVDEFPTDITVTTPAGDSATYTNPEESESTVPPTPASALAGAPAAPTTPLVISDRAPDLRQIFAAIAGVKADPSSEDARNVLAALTDIKLAAANSLGAGAEIPPNWVGQLQQGAAYVREYITLGRLGTNITATGKKGFRVHRGTKAAPVDKFDGSWAGDKAAVNSYPGWAETATSTLKKFGIGEDIAREFYDLPGGAEVVEAFLSLIVEDHLRWSDDAALAAWIAAAGAPIAPQVYPDVDGHDYAGAMGMAIQGILRVKRRKADGRRDVPTFIIANEMAYEEMLYTPKDLIPEFVTFNVNTDSEGTADGRIKIVQGDTGIEGSSSVIVGADYAIEFDEIAGGPLKIDALDIARGGIDKAVHGYLQTFPVRTEAVVHIGTADVVAP